MKIIIKYIKNNKLLIFFVLILLFIIFIRLSYMKNNNNNNNKANDIKKYTYYINLENRKDRKRDTLKELKSFGINNPTRFNAIKEDIGMIGCGKSHLEVLKIARKNNLPYVLIFEDDVKFLNPDVTNKTLNNILKSEIDWDVILLGGNNYEPYTKVNEDCIKVNNCQCCTAYLVKQSYYDTLISNWEKGLSKLIETKNESKYSLDQYWKILQKQDTFLLLTPLNVIQRPSYSDISNSYVDYEKIMKNYN